MVRAGRFSRFAAAAVAALVAAPFAHAGGHTWRISEVFSNADGSIQYVEAGEAFGGDGEVNTNGRMITSTANSFTITANVSPPTGFRKLLFATPGFAALEGAPTPDYIIPAGSVPFFSVAGDTVRYVPYDTTFSFSAEALPIDGVHSLNRDGSVGCNTPENYAGEVGFVNVGCAMSGDVDGSGAVDGGDVAAFLRVVTGAPDVGDQVACAEYCAGSLADTIAAFVADLLG